MGRDYRCRRGQRRVDLFIAEPELCGIGTELLRRFALEVVFARPDVICCVADPDVENLASVRAFEKAGFAATHEFVDPDDNRSHVLMRLDRD